MYRMNVQELCLDCSSFAYKWKVGNLFSSEILGFSKYSAVFPKSYIQLTWAPMRKKNFGCLLSHDILLDYLHFGTGHTNLHNISTISVFSKLTISNCQILQWWKVSFTLNSISTHTHTILSENCGNYCRHRTKQVLLLVT